MCVVADRRDPGASAVNGRDAGLKLRFAGGRSPGRRYLHQFSPIEGLACRMPNDLFQTFRFDDLAIGMRATIRKTVGNEDVIGFAELSGDHDPIHLSEHFARKTRLGGRIVRGLYTASLISAVIGMRLPGPGAVYISQTLNFRGPVKIGDGVDVSVEVVELIEKGRRLRLHCECRVGDAVVLDGEGVLSVPTAAEGSHAAP